jgi:molecular chaperone GrpE
LKFAGVSPYAEQYIVFFGDFCMSSHPEANRPSESTEGTSPVDEGRVQPEEGQAQAQPAPSEVEQLTAEVEKLKAELADKHEQVLRRRAQEDVSKARKFAIESFAESLVPVRDSLEAALALEQQTLETMREGVETTLKQLSSAFERHHLKEIKPETGAKFDPHHHQAIATIPAEQPANTVVAVLQKGYLITDRVLRPALVTVAS